jgi:protoheme IX farnesyltransferase
MAVVGLYLLYFNRFAWKSHRNSRLILTFSNMLVVLFLAQGFVGALKLIPGTPLYLDVLHKLTGAVLAVVGGILVSGATGKQSVSSEGEVESVPHGSIGQRVKDFIALTKPIVVLLLLATTFGGMVMGARGFPSWDVIVVTLVSGALAAGGSGAVNQYLDRDLDGVMARTSKRPIPAGRLTSAEGLAFGVTAIVVSFYLLAGFVNILAALLTLAGMLYYVILYSILLKKRTVQNIVIGGGAGAVPPLVGWAAATGSLDLTAGFLFLIIFLWTPPHFWALALTRSNEYRDAGVPMMPVEKGEDVTRKLIFQYTIVLVLSTLVMWALGLAGWLFLASAIILGGYLVWLALMVWRSGRNRVYYKMYRHSNYYLLLLFVILAIDSVVLGA